MVSLPLTNGKNLNNTHSTIFGHFSGYFTKSELQFSPPKFSNSTAPSDVIPRRLCKIVSTVSGPHCVNYCNTSERTVSKSIQIRCPEAALKAD